MSTRTTTFRDALVASNEVERIIDAIVLDVFYSLVVQAESGVVCHQADLQPTIDHIYEVVNFYPDGSRYLDEAGEEEELITKARIAKALSRASARGGGYLDGLQKFHAGLVDVAILEPRTWLHRDVDSKEYSLCTPSGGEMVSVVVSECEAMEMAGDWIEHYMVEVCS